MLTYILIAVAAVIAVLVLVVALRPGDFRITRKALIKAPPAAVFDQVNDFRKWPAWSPWERIDPNLERRYEGPSTGEGSTYSWVGNKQVGEGRMTIVESRPGELVRIKLEFFKPFTATNEAHFMFKPQGDRTEITWSMTGVRSFCMKAICMVMNMDKMVGGQFDQGLANMKTVLESPPAAQPAGVASSG